VNLNDAYRRCEEITATEARNFSYGIKLLPPPKRQAMSALYAMARRIDDIGDGDAAAPVKLEALAAVRTDLDGLTGEHVPRRDDAVLLALSDVVRRYHIPLPAFHQLVDGCQMDVEGTQYRDFDELIGYCRRVAGTVGRLSLAVYGTVNPERAAPLADDLGVALQITNILRDVIEDREQMGRVYLPAADRARFDVADDLSGPRDGVLALITFEAARAEEWYGRGLALLPMLDWRSRACTAAMAGIYHRLLVRIQRDPAGVLRGRISLPGREKAAVAGRALLRGAA
jgi:phytoene synthase